MSDSVKTVNPLLCPLCAKANACQSASNTNTDSFSCWCQNPEASFPPELMQQVPDQAKNKACICASCAKSFTLSL